MQLSLVFAGAAAALASVSAQTNMPLPWDGRAQDLTVDTITDKYLTHILTMRDNNVTGDVADYVTIDPTGRSPAFNDDTGVINIAVDNSSIFKTQYNFRRSELVQFIEGNEDGPTFFRTSLKKDEAFLNPYQWQLIFPESHTFEIRVDATLDPPMLIYLNNGTYDAKWETEFVPGTWYNFGIAVSKGTTTNTAIDFYTSEGDDELELVASHDTVSEFATSYEFHIGALTLSSDGSQPVMNAEQDILSYNGVSVENSVDGAASTAASTAASAADSASTDASEADTSSSEVEGEASDAAESAADEEPAATTAAPANCKGRI